MPMFDFITEKDLRVSLEGDYAEMQKCVEASAWKSGQVLAGSIVEALLVDYLVATPNPARAPNNPLRIDLADAITICRTEKVLSDRSADLCSVIRSYRNLIHPGRMLRLAEAAPTKQSSAVAGALIDMIVEDLAKARRASVGLTAEQIVSKVRRDSHVGSILKHLLTEVKEQQKERLLLELLPSACQEELRSEEFSDAGVLERLVDPHRVVLNSAEEPTKRRVAEEFVRVLREEDGERVIEYGDAFFSASDLRWLPAAQREMVVAHLLNRIPNIQTEATLRLLDGILPFLENHRVLKWVDSFVRTVTNVSRHTPRKSARDRFVGEVIGASPEVWAKVKERLDAWGTTYRENGSTERLTALEEMCDDAASYFDPPLD